MLGDILSKLAEGFLIVMNIKTILLMAIGSILGLVAGAVPGMGSLMVMGVLLPITYTMVPSNAILLLLAVYKGVNTGGSYSSILLNVPGTAAAVATTFDGHPLAKQGKSRKALEAAIYGSTFGGIVASITLVFGVKLLSKVALGLQSPDKFLLILFALLLTATVVEISPIKGIMSVSLGLVLGLVGLDSITGLPRLGIIKQLGVLEGLDMAAVLVGLLALSEIIKGLADLRQDVKDKVKATVHSVVGEGLTWAEIRDSIKALNIGTVVGIIFGALPGLGPTAASFSSYSLTKVVYRDKSKHGVEFGKGAVPGIFACEAANSAVPGSNMIPLLTLGIPGDVAAALLLAAFMLHGIIPGPGIMFEQSTMVYTIYAGLLVADLLNLVIAKLILKPIAFMLRSNLSIVYPIVVMLCMTGIYTINSRVLDVGVFIFAGLFGYFISYAGIPLPPMAIGFVLSRNLEIYLRQSIAVSHGKVSIFFSSYTSIFIIVMIVAFIVFFGLKQKTIHHNDVSLG